MPLCDQMLLVTDEPVVLEEGERALFLVRVRLVVLAGHERHPGRVGRPSSFARTARLRRRVIHQVGRRRWRVGIRQQVPGDVEEARRRR